VSAVPDLLAALEACERRRTLAEDSTRSSAKWCASIRADPSARRLRHSVGWLGVLGPDHARLNQHRWRRADARQNPFRGIQSFWHALPALKIAPPPGVWKSRGGANRAASPRGTRCARAAGTCPRHPPGETHRRSSAACYHGLDFRSRPSRLTAGRSGTARRGILVGHAERACLVRPLGKRDPGRLLATIQGPSAWLQRRVWYVTPRRVAGP
jgi:hypothetical protein